MHAAVIAAGEGTRLRPSFPDTPKPLVPLQGTPLIGWLLTQLERVGFSRVSIVIRDDQPDVHSYLTTRPTTLSVDVVQRSTDGGFHSLLALESYLQAEGGFFLFTVDNVFRIEDLERFVHINHAASGSAVTTWVTRRLPGVEGQVGVELDSSLRVLSIGKTIVDSPYVAEGPFYCRPSIFSERDRAVSQGIVRFSDYLALLARGDHVMYGYLVDEVLDIDDWDDYCVALRFLADHSGEPASGDRLG